MTLSQENYTVCSQDELDFNQQKMVSNPLNVIVLTNSLLMDCSFCLGWIKTIWFLGFTCPQLDFTLGRAKLQKSTESWIDDVPMTEKWLSQRAWFDDQSATKCTFMFLMYLSHIYLYMYIISYHIISYHIISYHIYIYIIILSHIISHDIISLKQNGDVKQQTPRHPFCNTWAIKDAPVEFLWGVLLLGLLGISTSHTGCDLNPPDSAAGGSYQSGKFLSKVRIRIWGVMDRFGESLW